MNNHTHTTKILNGIGLIALLFAVTNASAQIITNAYDLATNYAAAGNFNTGDNQGSGFGPWTITASGGGQTLTADDNSSYGLYAFTITNQAANGVTTANRPFASALPVGGSFSIRLRLNHLDNSSYTNGFQLQDNSGNVLFSYYHKGGDGNNGWFTDASGTGVATNFAYNYQSFSSLTFTLNSATSYTFKDNGSGASSGSFTGTLSGAAITQVTFFRANGSPSPSDGQNLDVNALAITTLGAKPVFTVQPNNAAAVAGGTVSLNATATSNLGTPSYQWYFTNSPITGATGTNLVLANVGTTNAGSYYIVATNTAGATTSSVVVVTVIPFGYTNAYDVAANYSGFTGNQGYGFSNWVISAVGGGDYISGDSPPLFGIWNNTGGDASTATRPFVTNLVVGGSFLIQLENGHLDNSTNNNILELQDASGNVLFSYWHGGSESDQGNGWYSDAGVTVGVASNFWYHFGQVDTFAFTLTSATSYKFTDFASGASLTGTLSGAPITQVTLVRTNGWLGSQSSGQDFKFNSPTILTPIPPIPQFTAQPLYDGGLVGSTINLSGTAVSAVGSLTYQWYFNGALVSGATNSNLALGNASLANSGSYVLVVSNPYGSVTSAVSVVTVYVENNRLLAYEGFDYEDSVAIDGTSQNGGLGWSGAWQNVAGTGSLINPGNLVGGTNAPLGYDSLSTSNSYYGYDGNRAGRYLNCSTSGALAARGYIDSNGNIGGAGKTLYVSFLMQPDLTAPFYEFEFHRANLNDPGRIAGIGNNQAVGSTNTDVYFRAPNGVFTDLGVGDSFEDPSVGNHAVDFYVVRIDFHGGNDNVSVYRNPTSLTEPAIPTVTLTNVGNMSFNGISLGSYGNNLAIDEIRLGATWSDALGMPGANSMMRPVRQGNGWNILFAGNPAFTYRVQRATGLTGGWTDLGTATPLENGIGTINDPNPPASGAFYRTVTP